VINRNVVDQQTLQPRFTTYAFLSAGCTRVGCFTGSFRVTAALNSFRQLKIYLVWRCCVDDDMWLICRLPLRFVEISDFDENSLS